MTRSTSAKWTFTPGIRYEMIEQQQTNLLTHVKYKGDYNTPLPALNVLYHVDSWNLYANTEELVWQCAIQPDAKPGQRWRGQTGKSPYVGARHPL